LDFYYNLKNLSQWW